jgi:DNA-binding transcriptional ArsR family regulator
LADPTRRDIVARLADGDATVTALAAPYDVSVQAVAKHLKVLEDAGVVSRARRGGDGRPPRGGGVRPDDGLDRALPPPAEERYRRLDEVLAGLPDDDRTPHDGDQEQAT